MKKYIVSKYRGKPVVFEVTSITKHDSYYKAERQAAMRNKIEQSKYTIIL